VRVVLSELAILKANAFYLSGGARRRAGKFSLVAPVGLFEPPAMLN
jgi:hypothetical protein